MVQLVAFVVVSVDDAGRCFCHGKVLPHYTRGRNMHSAVATAVVFVAVGIALQLKLDCNERLVNWLASVARFGSYYYQAHEPEILEKAEDSIDPKR